MKEKKKAFTYHGKQVYLVRLKKGERFRSSIWYDGKSYTLSAKSKDEIKQKIEQAERGELATQQKGNKSEESLKGMTDVWNDFLKARAGKVQENTFRKYQQAYEAHINYFSKYKMNNITPEVIDCFIRTELKGLKKGTIDTHTRILFAFLKWAYDNDKIDKLITKSDVPALWITKSIAKQQVSKIHTMTIEEYEEYKKLYLQNRCGGDFALACDLCFYAGLRISEAIGLRGVDILKTPGGYNIAVEQKAAITLDKNGKKKQIISSILKSQNSRRVIPIPSWMGEKIKARSENNKSKDGIILTRINICTFSSYHAKINSLIRKDNETKMDEEKIKIITVHELRKSFLTRCALSGMDVYTLQKIAGHDSIDTTQKYYIGINNNEAAEKARKVLSIDDKE